MFENVYVVIFNGSMESFVNYMFWMQTVTDMHIYIYRQSSSSNLHCLQYYEYRGGLLTKEIWSPVFFLVCNNVRIVKPV